MPEHHAGPGRSRPLTQAGESIRLFEGTKVMHERLTKLTRFGVVERRAVSEKPPHVECHLTAKGRQLAGLVREIQQFCARWDESAAGAEPPRAPRAPSSRHTVRMAASARQELVR